MLLCLFVCFFFLLLYYALWFAVETCTWCLRWQELKWTGLQHVVLCLYGNVQHLLWLWIPETSTNFLQLPFIHTVDLGVSSFLENLCFTSLSSLTHHLTLGLYWRLVKWAEEKGSIILGLDLSLLMGRCLWAVNFVSVSPLHKCPTFSLSLQQRMKKAWGKWIWINALPPAGIMLH